jgi:HSP20 family protein
MNAHLLPSLWARLYQLPPGTDSLPNGHDEAVSSPPINVWEEAEAFHVEAELPGVPQDKVNVTVTDGTDLLLEGEHPATSNAAFLRRERGVGRFRRLLRFPLPVEADKVEARLENGVLHLTLPKADRVRPRRIEVKS